MLYYLFRFLEQFGISGAHMWSYISFRALLALVLALFISAWFGEYFIKWMRRRNGYEPQRDPNVDPFGMNKIGVPSMGGIIILVSILVPCLLFGRLRNVYMLLMLLTTLWFGALGFADDYLKMKHSKDGMPPRLKLLGQFALGLVVGLALWLSPDAVVRENLAVDKGHKTETVVGVKHHVVNGITYTSTPSKSTVTTIPFVKNNNLHYSDVFRWMGRYRTAAGWMLFVIVTTFVVMAVSNGANLNDGMDGMCAGNSAIIVVALGILAYVSSHIEYASYLNIMYVPGSEELVIFCCAMVGALVGFLWYNAYPAQIFMGDTGSLSIGGIIAVLAIIIHKELLLPLLCFVFFIESVSVILQNRFARRGNRKGQKWRFFRRAPIHDAFRVLDRQIAQSAGVDDIGKVRIRINWPHTQWHESKITARFWIITLVCVALAIITLKTR